jgi:hypothetical protein
VCRMHLEGMHSTLHTVSGSQQNHPNTAPTTPRTCTQPFTLPAYAGLTLGGILATSSHGTGDQKPSSLIEMVVEAVSNQITAAGYLFGP